MWLFSAAYPQDIANVGGYRNAGREAARFLYSRPFTGRVGALIPLTKASQVLNLLAKIFTWWNGATIGTLFTIAKRGELVGTDEYGNRYYQSRDTSSYDGRKRRWVIYAGYAEATKVAPDWHGWLRYTFDEPPPEDGMARRSWELPHLPNLTGTPMAWRPKGSLAAEGRRPAATGDYQAWTPEG
jgi:NADH:ubiquinone oxidoreductase subunit